MVDPFGEVGTRRVESRLFDSPYYREGADAITAFPLLKSVQAIWTGKGQGVLNITEAGVLPNSSTLYLTLNNTNQFLLEAVVVVVILREPQLKQLPLSAYEYSTLTAALNSSDTARTISATAKAVFHINYKFSPQLEPKCLVGLQKVHSWPESRATLAFNLTLGGVTQLAASPNYFVQYGFLCVADIECANAGEQYYHLLGTCEATCAITNCEECSSSTSCLRCSSGYFVNGLFRCGRCSANCQTCLSERECTTCLTSYYPSTGG